MSELDRVAAFLRVAAGVSGPVAPSSEAWPQWTSLARMQRVTPLLYQLVEFVPTDLTDEQRRQAVARHGAVLLRCVELEHFLLRASEDLRDHGIDSVVLKGGATAHLDYPDPSWREVSDIDLLVGLRDRDRAIELLGRDGWVQGYALPHGHLELTHAVTLVRHDRELDLHQRIARRALGLRVPTRDLFSASREFEVAGVTLRALSDVDRVIHAAVHMETATNFTRRLSSVADVLVMVERRPERAADVLARAERWRVRPMVEVAIRNAYTMAQLDVGEEWADAMRRPIHARDRLVDRAYLGERRSPALMELAYLRLLSWRQRWTYLRGFLSAPELDGAPQRRSGVRAQARYVLEKLGWRRH